MNPALVSDAGYAVGAGAGAAFEEVQNQQNAEISVGREISADSTDSSVATEVSVDDNDFQVTVATDTGRGGNPARHWVFTIHAEHPTDACEDTRRCGWRPPSLTGKMRYLVCQQERGADTGRLHWQGYVQFTNAIRATQVRSLLCCPWAWVKPARGTPQQARAYCTKDDTRLPDTVPIEYGTLVEAQGKRNDLDAIYDMIKQGARMYSILEAQPTAFMKYQRGIQAAACIARNAAAQRSERDVEVIVVWGPPGSGKTRWVWDQWGSGDMYTLNLSGTVIWWDGYDGHETVLMDDYAGQIPYRLLLTYLDRYAIQCPIKGGMVSLQAKRIVLTSNLHWSDWYQQDTQGRRDPSALQRRIGQVRHVPAWGAPHVVQTRGDPTDPLQWVPLPIPAQHAPGFNP